MSEETTSAYVVIINLALPGSNEQFSANVTLLPEDAIPNGAQGKKLKDCTLADLQAYADKLEADVWDTYQQITVMELASDEALEIELSVLDAQGAEVELSADWLDAIVLAPPSPEEAPPPVAEKATEPPAPTETPPTYQADSDEPVILVEQTQSVHEEETEPSQTAVSTEPSVIAPSKARVRMAGQQLPLGHPTWAAVDILIEEPALRAAQAHALTSMNREVAGVLVGPRPEKQPDGRYLVHISDTIIAQHTVMHGASVTYTPESWRYMNDVLHERYPDETAVMVGWYHTHPGFGIFLSGMDLFIHQNFFTQIWHIAYVLDPRARTSGFFCWDRPKTQVKPVEFRWPSWAPGSW
jgi:proteasome lid subunit RPN8/RPN11